MRARNLLWVWASSWLATACAGSAQTVCRPDPITGSDRCSQTGGYGDAAITGGVAAGAWGVAGCTVNGCEPPFRCNGKTKQCERTTCNETKDCPPGYECNASDLKCR